MLTAKLSSVMPFHEISNNNAKDTSGRIGNSDSKSKGKDKSSADSSKAANAPIEIDARDIKFLEDLKKILYYSTKQSSEG